MPAGSLCYRILTQIAIGRIDWRRAGLEVHYKVYIINELFGVGEGHRKVI